MSGFDRGSVYSQEVLPAADDGTKDHNDTIEKFVKFIREFRVNNNFIYRDQLRQNANTNQNFLDVDVRDLIAFDDVLANSLSRQPGELLPMFESAVAKVAQQLLRAGTLPQNNSETVLPPDYQILLRADSNPIAIRNLTSDHISKLVRVPGIIIAANSVVAKATSLQCTCSNCGHAVTIRVKPGLAGAQLPRVCPKGPQGEVNKGQTKCPLDPFQINPDKSSYVDHQLLKIQEAPDMVPVGELPRSMLVTTDRYLANLAVPGTRVILIGVYSITQKNQMKKGAPSSVAIRNPYLRVVGMQIDTDGSGRASKKSFTPEEEANMIALSRLPDIYERFAASIAPSIYGFNDIKKSVACLLMGGSRKILPDGMRLRGDINVLLLGDPGTAKSQMLKFVEKVAPIGLYTSGKGSSAAGLTASVVRDSGSSDFYLEGGAMVLADGGVVCIDEFDKMREEDRVAIHEAMEQQTISIAKAGITTILNTRTSVLAAANPVFGRYDDMRSPAENIDFQSTILSRFDMIYLVKDEHNEANDIRLAKHVMGVHMSAGASSSSSSAAGSSSRAGEGPAGAQQNGDFDIQTMKSYVSYCKTRCGPRLSPEAVERLSNYFVTIRSDVRSKEVDLAERSTIPITIRQLEAIVRIAESLAKIGLNPATNEQHVEEAIRLFRVSTMAAVDSGQVIEGITRRDMMDEVDNVEGEIRRRLPVGSVVSEKRLMDEFGKKHSTYAIEKAIQLMVRREDLQFRSQGRSVVRIR